MIEAREFLTILAKLAALYPRFKLDRVTVDAYYDILGDLDTHILKAAALQFGSEPGPWYPSAGDLRAKAFDLIDADSGHPPAGEAWAEALRRLNIWNPASKEDYSDPLIFEALEGIGGAIRVGMTAEDMLMSSRARFMDVYKQLVKRRRIQARMLPQVKAAVKQLTAQTARRLTAKGDRNGKRQDDQVER